MRKIVATLFILSGLLTNIQSQTVDSIKIEQAGDLIKIHYNILSSNEFQIFRVTVFCSINGGLKSELKSLSGDYGNNVVGGRSGYMVLWDVLKDVDEVRSVDFSIRAELIKDNTPKSIEDTKSKWEDKNTYLMFSSTQVQDKSTFGIRLAYMGKWGISGKYVARSFEFNSTKKVTLFHTGIDLTKRIVKKEGFSMHIIAGINYGKFLTYNLDLYEESGSIEMGTIITLNRIAISFAGSSYKDNFIANFGIGVRF